MEHINDALLAYLPFSTESLMSWGEKSDLYRFLSELSNHEGILVTANGERETVNYRASGYGDKLFHAGKRRFRSWAYHFMHSAEKNVDAYRGFANSVSLPDFYESESFGTVAKYVVAWDGLVNNALSSGTFFSIAHILESEDDLRCSLKLASELYYKHAIQVLRSFLEDLVLPVYFATNPPAYARWRENNYRTPPLRGPKGVLNKLVNKEVLFDELRNHVGELYDNLNSFIHGSEQRLINSGHYTKDWVGHAFKEESYLEWCTYVSTAVTLAIHLLRINLAQWEQFREERRIVCPICHNDRDFSANEFTFGGEMFTQYGCQSCGKEMTHSFDGRQAYGQWFDGKLFSYQY